MEIDWQLAIDPTRPIYGQIVDALVGRIARGEVAPGEALPSVRALALALRVNPNTVQRAYRDMEAMGVAESHPGQGTFVRADRAGLARLRDGAAAGIVARAVADLRALGLDDLSIRRRLAQALESRGSNT
jgi:GntR family transcriptional regulator